MDAVRRAIETLGGSIQTRSTAGDGTTVALRLPLTLAIVDGLLVRIGTQTYVLPLASVTEIIEYDRSAIERGGMAQLMRVGTTQVPVIDLHNVFWSESTPREQRQVVLVDWDRGKAGFVVGEVLGRQQTVIKSLGAVQHDVDAVSGATILADGSVSLILDVPKLIHEAANRAGSAVRTV
jgi:two-component system chemotaxis sensor kinase CheA